MQRLQLPAEWVARSYQRPLWQAMMRQRDPLKRAVAIWPRRGGKDRTALAITSVKAMQLPRTYWHMLPTNVQARRVVWDAVDRLTGQPLLDRVFPKEIVRSKNEAEMCLELKGGSRWYAVGSDNYNRLLGSDPYGVIFSEYSVADPAAWNYIRPILAENGGWAIFLYTPRGRNHGYSLYNMAAGNPQWFCEKLSCEDTCHITADDIEEERRAGMSEELVQQEFFCSFSAGAAGAFYGSELERLRADGRLTEVPYDPNYALELWFDLGYNDATSVWFMQPRGLKLCAVRYKEWRGKGIPSIAAEIRQLGYRIDLLRLPHDGDVHDQTTGRTRTEVWEDELRTRSDVAPRPRNKDEFMQQIENVRRLIAGLWIDSAACEAGMAALESYCRRYDDKLKRHVDQPQHDWASHGADALRTGAVRYAPGEFGGAPGMAKNARAGPRLNRPQVITRRNGLQPRKPFERIDEV